jgi:hypothetical protein
VPESGEEEVVGVSELVRFQNADGDELIVEVDEDLYGSQRVSRDENGIVTAANRLEQALQSAAPALQSVARTVRAMAPDEHEIEFGLKLSAEAGAIVAKTAAEGHFTVKLRWSRPDWQKP